MDLSADSRCTANCPRRGVATVGNGAGIGTWSGIPFYLLQAGRDCGFLTDGLDLAVNGYATWRSIWQAGRVLHLQRPRGFQFSPTYLDLLGRRAVAECARLGLQEVISHYQLLPARVLSQQSVRTSFYIDTTLLDLFKTHGVTWLNRRITQAAIEREGAEFHAATRIVTMASWATESVVDAHGVPRERVFTVLAGANLPEAQLRARLNEKGPIIVPQRFTQERPFRLGFTGKDWERKGLPRLVAAAEILNRSGVPTKVIVIGNMPQHYRNHQSVIHAGFIDKASELQRFIETVEQCDLGCAPSHVEPMGIAPLEYLRLGVPVLCTAAGGLRDVCAAADGASALLDKDASPEEIAAELELLARNPERLQDMRAVAWARKEHFSWERTVNELERIWNPAHRNISSRSVCTPWVEKTTLTKC